MPWLRMTPADKPGPSLDGRIPGRIGKTVVIAEYLYQLSQEASEALTRRHFGKICFRFVRPPKCDPPGGVLDDEMECNAIHLPVGELQHLDQMRDRARKAPPPRRKAARYALTFGLGCIALLLLLPPQPAPPRVRMALGLSRTGLP